MLGEIVLSSMALSNRNFMQAIQAYQKFLVATFFKNEKKDKIYFNNLFDLSQHI